MRRAPSAAVDVACYRALRRRVQRFAGRVRRFVRGDGMLPLLVAYSLRAGLHNDIGRLKRDVDRLLAMVSTLLTVRKGV